MRRGGGHDRCELGRAKKGHVVLVAAATIAVLERLAPPSACRFTPGGGGDPPSAPPSSRP